MPYVITTVERESCPDCNGDPWSRSIATGEHGCESCSNHGTHLVPVSRRAVATLDEARIAVSTWITDRWSSNPAFAHGDGELYQPKTRPMVAQADTLPESGGTVGPLPDGTVIEVKRVGWRFIEDSIGYHLGHPDGPVAALAAYNAAQEARA